MHQAKCKSHECATLPIKSMCSLFKGMPSLSKTCVNNVVSCTRKMLHGCIGPAIAQDTKCAGISPTPAAEALCNQCCNVASTAALWPRRFQEELFPLDRGATFKRPLKSSVQILLPAGASSMRQTAASTSSLSYQHFFVIWTFLCSAFQLAFFLAWFTASTTSRSSGR